MTTAIAAPVLIIDIIDNRGMQLTGKSGSQTRSNKHSNVAKAMGRDSRMCRANLPSRCQNTTANKTSAAIASEIK